MKGYYANKKFNKRVVVSGKVVELYEYEKPVIKGTGKRRVGRAGFGVTTENTKERNRQKTAFRACRLVRNTINANPELNKFLTLTFGVNETNLNIARYEFDKFVKRLKTYFANFKYIEVVEFQKRGAIHFHLLCNLPYIEIGYLSKIWGNGFVKINRIDNIDNVGAYITKYMTKDNIDERLVGRKCYSMSKGLKKPKEYTKEQDIDEILENIDCVKRMYTNEFECEYYGRVRYTQIICANIPPKPDERFRRWLSRFKGRLTLMPDSIPCPFN